MNAFIERALKTFCTSHRVFGESSIYVRFDREPTPPSVETDGFNSDIVFGRIVYQSQTGGEERISPPLTLKVVPRFCQKSRDYLLMQYFTEMHFWTEAAPQFQQMGDFQMLLPKFYDCQIQMSVDISHCMIIMENLRPQGFRGARRHSFLDLDHLLLMLRKLGNFHSFSYAAKRASPQKFDVLSKWFHHSQMIWTEQYTNGLAVFARRGIQPLRSDRRYSNRLAHIEEVVESAEEFMNYLCTMEQTEPLSVVCHGDFLRNNVLFRYENDKPVDMKIIDFGYCRVASPVIDLSTVLYVNSDQKMRDQHWDSLIDSYFTGLCELFGSEALPSKDSIVSEFFKKALFGFFVACNFLGDLIAKDEGLPNMYQLLPKEYVGSAIEELPKEIVEHVCLVVGGEDGTNAIADVLRDIIDRGFVAS